MNGGSTASSIPSAAQAVAWAQQKGAWGSLKAVGRYGWDHMIPIQGAWTAVSTFREKRAHGANAFAAGAAAVMKAAPLLLLPGNVQLAYQIGLPLATMATTMMLSKVADHNQQIRLARTAFSHRFEHTEVTARAQAIALQSIGSAWGHAQMGGEAAQMARRYGR